MQRPPDSKCEVLWFLDRFGLPGKYRLLWAQMAREAGIKPTSVKFVSLHSILKGQLLTRYASRKAPTWVPEREAQLRQAIRAQIKLAGPSLKCVVLSAPESLSIIGLHPENATLNKLRGSVYQIDGIPHLVMLPMSAWLTQVTSKDIGAANYGLESGEALSASAAAVTAALNQRGDHHDGRGHSAFGESVAQLSGGPAHGVVGVSAANLGATGAGGTVADSGGGDIHGDGGDDLPHLARVRGGHVLHDSGSGAVRGGDGGVLRRSGDSDPVGFGFREPDGLELTDDDEDESDSDEGGERADGDGEGEDEFEVDDSDPDAFWYEPVMVPVGKMMLRFDSRKLARIVNGESGSFFDAI